MNDKATGTANPTPRGFLNSADAHPADVVQTQCRLSVMVGDHGLPDLLALLADAVKRQNDCGMRDVRNVLDTRADAILALANVIR